jgi:hypothetical protein
METEAGAAVTRARLLQGATLSSSSEAAPVWFGLKRRVLCPLRDLPCLALYLSRCRPIVRFWDRAFRGCCFLFLTDVKSAVARENAVLKPASQAPC